MVFCYVCFADPDCRIGEDKQSNCEVLNTFQLADVSHPLTFNHHCSKEDLSPYWQAYVLFEYELDNKKKAVVVGKLDIGFIRGVQQIQGMRLIIEKLRLKGFSHWSEYRLGLALQAVHTRSGQKVTEEFLSSYYYAKRGTGEIRDFKITSSGDFLWERIIEPEVQTEENKGESRGLNTFPYVFAESIEFPEEEHRFNFLIKNLNTGEIITLAGPVIGNLKDRLQLEQPESKTLGFFGALNPFQKGGIVSVLSSGFRYGDCIYLRKQSKYELDQRFQ